MMSATKLTVKKKPSMRSPLAASPQPIKLSAGMTEQISKKAFELGKSEGIETDTISMTGSMPRPS